MGDVVYLDAYRKRKRIEEQSFDELKKEYTEIMLASGDSGMMQLYEFLFGDDDEPV